MKKVAILQSNYLPWKGYFDLIASVDEFIILDEVQFTRRDWRNRNIIKTHSGPKWLTVPVATKGLRPQRICDTKIVGHKWRDKHIRQIKGSYRQCQYFEQIMAIIQPIIQDGLQTHLSTLNRELLEVICSFLGISTQITSTQKYKKTGSSSERLISICLQAGATEYFSGPKGKDYLDEGKFADAGINVTWADYTGYPEYAQQWGGFEPNVTIIDLLFNCGHNSTEFMKYKL